MKDLQNLDEVESVRNLLKGSSLRCTPARIAVLIALRRAKSPQTHADLSNQLVPLGFDKATVFRNLTDLTQVGLVHRPSSVITYGDLRYASTMKMNRAIHTFSVLIVEVFRVSNSESSPKRISRKARSSVAFLRCS